MKEDQIDIVNIQNILKGDKLIEKILYEKYKVFVQKILQKNYPNNHNDDDLSEIMIKIFSNLKNFDENKAKFSSWVYELIKNFMIDKWRCCRCNNTISLDKSFNTTTTINNSSTFNSDVTAFNQPDVIFETSSSINHISSQLSSCDYMFLDMKYIQGYSYDEIGKEFNLTSSTVSNRVNYLKNKLKNNNKNFYLD